MTENAVIKKENVFEPLWELEKQLIVCLDELDQKKAAKKANAQKFTVDGVIQHASTRTVNRPYRPTVPAIILPTNSSSPSFSQQSPGRRQQFQGGSIADRLKYLEDIAPKAEKTSGKILTIDQNSVELEELDRMLRGGTLPQRSVHNDVGANRVTDIAQELTEVEKKVHDLSIKILELRKENGLEKWICDYLTVYDINIKMGGDGTFIDSETGSSQPMPKHPLSKTCPHRHETSQYPRVLRCVVCPANYSDTPERFDAWLDYVKARQEANKKNNEEQD